MKAFRIFILFILCISFSSAVFGARTVNLNDETMDTLNQIKDGQKGMDEIKLQMDTHFTALDKRFDQTDKKIAKINERLDQNENEKEKLNEADKFVMTLAFITVLVVSLIIWDILKRQTVIKDEVNKITVKEKQLLLRMAAGFLKYSEKDADLRKVLKQLQIMQHVKQIRQEL